MTGALTDDMSLPKLPNQELDERVVTCKLDLSGKQISRVFPRN